MDLKEISCDPTCGFMVRSHDEHEVLSDTQKHVLAHHKEHKSFDDLRKDMKTVTM